MEGLRCIDEFTLKCLDREHRAYFNTLYAGTTQVIIDLCQEGDYQKGNYEDEKVQSVGVNVLIFKIFSLKNGENISFLTQDTARLCKK
jgi:hypothetical protein